MKRNELPVMSVFEYVDGKKGHHYLNLGQAKRSFPDKDFSVNTTTNALASSRRDSRTPKNVRLIGTGTFAVSPFASNAQDAMERGSVPIGGVYAIQNSKSVNDDAPTIYIHLGELDRGQYLSLNPNTGNLVVSRDAQKRVIHVGDAAVSVVAC